MRFDIMVVTDRINSALSEFSDEINPRTFNKCRLTGRTSFGASFVILSVEGIPNRFRGMRAGVIDVKMYSRSLTEREREFLRTISSSFR